LLCIIVERCQRTFLLDLDQLRVWLQGIVKRPWPY
jgi:hypothetical protein